MNENLIELNNVRKEFVTAKHYPGFKGAVKGLFSKETVTKTAVDDISFAIQEGGDGRIYRKQWCGEIYHNQNDVRNPYADFRNLCGKRIGTIQRAKKEC